MATELKDDATHEEITEFVDKIVEDQQDPKEEVGDGKKIADDNAQPVTDTSAEEDSGSEDTADSETDDGEDTGEREWFDDSLKAEVTAYGIDEKDFADFTSREEVERALRVFDRRALEAGRKTMAEGDEGEQATKEPVAKEGAFEVSLDKDVYDEDLVNEFTRMRDYYEDRISTLEARFQEIDARAQDQVFDGLVDSLGHADLFGKSGKETPKELQRRKDLHVAAKAQLIGLQELGYEADLNEQLINRVARMVFADELAKKEWKQKTRKITRQSSGRQGGGQTRPQDPSESPRDAARRLYKELEGAG